MKSSVFGALVLVFQVLLLLVCCVQVKSVGGQTRKFITWDDFTVNEQNIASDGAERVIVVDQSGHGDSKTVQGAVDLVPENNTERIKIYIYPGTYRYIITRMSLRIVFKT